MRTNSMKKRIYAAGSLLLWFSVSLWPGCGKDGNTDASPAEVIQALEATMVYVEGGTFMMGATEEQGNDVWPNETPVHEIRLDGFYIGKFEVTQAQWKAVMGTALADMVAQNDWSAYGLGDNVPMYDVSWHDAVAFCARLSEVTGKTYRLPTEAEWEYAARGGQNAEGTRYAGSDDIDEVAWHEGNSWSLGSEHPDFCVHAVGQKRPNGLGLYDMSGNVWEWCQDWYGEDYYASSPAFNPPGPVNGALRVSRGGSWCSDERYCRVSFRDNANPGIWARNLGFRVVRAL